MIQVAVPEKNLEDFLKTAAELQVFIHYIFIIILLFSVGMRNEDLRGKKWIGDRKYNLLLSLKIWVRW